MNEYRQLAQWLVEFFEHKQPPKQYDGEWFDRTKNLLEQEGWYSMTGSEKVAFTSTKSPYVFKIGYNLQKRVACKEFDNYLWFRKWFPKYTIPTALVNERFLIQPKASMLHGRMPEINELIEEIEARYRVPSKPARYISTPELLSFWCHQYLNYEDGHLGNFGLWRKRIRWLDFSGEFVTDTQPLRSPPAQ